MAESELSVPFHREFPVIMTKRLWSDFNFGGSGRPPKNKLSKLIRHMNPETVTIPTINEISFSPASSDRCWTFRNQKVNASWLTWRMTHTFQSHIGNQPLRSRSAWSVRVSSLNTVYTRCSHFVDTIAKSWASRPGVVPLLSDSRFTG